MARLIRVNETEEQHNIRPLSKRHICKVCGEIGHTAKHYRHRYETVQI